MSYALVAGYDVHDEKPCPKTEVMYANGTTKICRSTSNYPENVHYFSGGSFIKINLIVACGGYVNTKNPPYTSTCYSMSNNDLKWTHFANLAKPGDGLASVIVNNGLWMTGSLDKFSLK
jgi:hypothetical protein